MGLARGAASGGAGGREDVDVGAAGADDDADFSGRAFTMSGASPG
jgi:hypothetical protein